MHRDTKLGLALAILVMGFAAALCFPRTPGEQTESLALQTAQELDTWIQHRGQVKIHPDTERPQPPVPEPVEVTPSVPVADSTTPASAVTEVLPLENSSGPAVAGTQSEPTPVNPTSFPAEVVAEPEQPVVHHKTYVVKHKDTLSAIALEHLGSAQKHEELLAANRDKLSSPESLRAGMVLVIPIPDGDEFTSTQGESFPVATSPSAESSSRVTPANPSPSPVQKRFRRPVNRLGSSAEPRLQ